MAILPFVVLGRQGALWILWLVIVNGAVEFWLARFFEGRGSLQRMLWSAFALNAVALAAAEVAFRAAWRESPLWVVRTVAVASACAATALGLGATWGALAERGAMGLGWLAWMGLVWYGWRVRRVDLFVLALALASAIVVVTVFLTVHVYVHAIVFSPFAIGVTVIGMAWKGTAWLRQVAAEEAA